MQNTLEIQNTKISYTIRKSKRARNVCIHIDKEGAVEVVVPNRVSELFAHRFVNDKKNWIFKTIQKVKQCKKLPLSGTKEEYLKYKDLAYEIISKKVVFWNELFKFEYNRVCIKNMKTQWGSCSCKRNLNFNYKMIFLPEEVVDYLVVHELAHLKEMNHSKRFWNLVSEAFPEYKKANRALRKINLQ
jgi:predicted metal-dependent hydrolase